MIVLANSWFVWWLNMATLGAFKNDNPSGILALNQIQMDSEQFLGASKLGKSSSAWKVCAWCVRCDPLLPRVGNSQCKIPESVYSLLASWFYQCLQFFDATFSNRTGMNRHCTQKRQEESMPILKVGIVDWSTSVLDLHNYFHEKVSTFNKS